MIKRRPFFTERIFPAMVLIAVFCCLNVDTFAQDEAGEEEQTTPFDGTAGPPPDFVPPPPPDFTPPSLPPSTRPPNSVINRTGSRSANQAASQPTEEELLQRESDLVDEEDPTMREVVGLIRIPEMGTNEVLEMLENFTRKPILRQQSLPSVKITFFSQGPLTRAEAITAIESLLALNGIAITSMGEKFLKAVPSAVITQQVARLWEGSTLEAIPTQTLYQKIFELDFLTTEEAASLLAPLMTQGAPIAFDKSHLLLITDSLINLQRIERLLPVLDHPAKLKTEMLFFQLNNIEAKEVAQRFQGLIEGPLRRQLQSNTTVEPDERTNQLVIFTHPTNVPLVENLVERLDIDMAPMTATKVYSIRYADATELVDIIEQIVTGQREIRQDTGGSTGPADAAAARQRAQQAATVRQSNQTVAAARAEASNLQFSDFLTIVPDERANTIVASGTHSDLSYLEQLIEEIDTLLAQVRIEVVITDVSLKENQQRGIDQFGFNYTGTGFNIDFEDPESTWNVDPTNFYGTSSFYGWEAGQFSMDIVLNRIAENDNIKVLSAPTIVTTHNKEATVSVGQEYPVVTQITSSDSAGTGGFVNRDQVQYRDVKLELKVTPLIGSDGVVQMEIEQQIQELGVLVDIGERQQPTINTRSAISYVSVRDGGLIALGGLQRLSKTENRGRMAILGFIPVLGDLFTSNNSTTDRTELLIFIRPTIVRTTEEADTDARKLIDSVEGADADIQNYLEKGTFRVEPEKDDVEEDKDLPRRRRR